MKDDKRDPAQGGEPLLRASQLEIGYAGRALLPPIGFEVRPGQLWGVIGPNGAGKTTLLRTLLGLQPPVSGAVIWHGRRAVGYVPQRTSLELGMPSRVRDVVRGGTVQGWGFVNPLGGLLARDRVHRALRDTDTERLARQQFASLSEGQKQRALMARALVCDPAVLLLDEPTSSMDVANEHQVFQRLRALARERNLAVLLITHHLSVVGSYASHLLLLDREAELAVAGTAVEVAYLDHLLEIFGHAIREEVGKRVAAGELAPPSLARRDGAAPTVPREM